MNCATAEGDLRVLQSEKVSTAKMIADGVTCDHAGWTRCRCRNRNGKRQAADRVGRLQQADRPEDRGDQIDLRHPIAGSTRLRYHQLFRLASRWSASATAAAHGSLLSR